MKNRLQVTTERLLYLFGGTLLVGSFTSGILNPDKRWMEWHFSRLGEGGMFSSYIFNFTIIIAAFLIYSIGKSITNEVSLVNGLPNLKIRSSKQLIGGSFNVVAFSMLVVATFPFDQFQVLHNIFGYTMLFVFLYLCVRISNILPVFSQKFYLYGFGIIAATVICYILFLAFEAISLLEVEIILFSLLYVWLVLFIKGLHACCEQVTSPVAK